MEVGTDSTIQPNNMYNYLDPTNNIFGGNINISAFLIVALVIIIFVALFMSLGNGNQDASQGMINASGEKDSGSALGIGMIALLVFVIVIGGLNYFYGSTITTSIKNFFSGNPIVKINVNEEIPKEPDVPPPPPPPPRPRRQNDKEVFNIPGNYFSYEDSKSICKAYGSRLATYDEVENAYNNGGEWCSYGWSDGQMALFPTQKNTYKQLQKTKGHENDCGRPGVNGGYMANPHLQFGVNCYGVKPYMTKEEQELMAVSTTYPKTEKDIALDKKVEYWKANLNEILVAPFNKTSWNKL
jgi:hypothetical protein